MDKKEKYFLSICILAYNRSAQLQRLLESIDLKYNKIEIVVAEDCSAERQKIRNIVSDFREKSNYTVNYYENEKNYGYDKNLRETAKKARGKWIMFMGNDDMYVNNSLDLFIKWLQRHDDVAYVLRRYRAIRDKGAVEEHRYAKKDVFFEAGDETIIELCRRSIFISGFTYKKVCFDDYGCDEYDGTLLFQIYILAVVCKYHKSAYCDIPITKWIVGGIPEFGMSESEKKLYKPGANTYQNSLTHLYQIITMTESIDKKLKSNIKQGVMDSYSKYSYGYLYAHRDDGITIFKNYAKDIKNMGLGNSIYFYIYYYALLVLGTKRCQKGINLIKRILGRTPKL